MAEIRGWVVGNRRIAMAEVGQAAVSMSARISVWVAVGSVGLGMTQWVWYRSGKLVRV